MEAVSGVAWMDSGSLASGWRGRGYWYGSTCEEILPRTERRGEKTPVRLAVKAPVKSRMKVPVNTPPYLIQLRNYWRPQKRRYTLVEFLCHFFFPSKSLSSL
jgi:hypothetical protein